jgi:Fe-S-cluster-containing hydrogenase component 2
MNAARARIAIFPRPAVKPAETSGTPVTCLQCDDAACVRVCQVGALQRSPVTGAIEIDQARCVRCKMCVTACPFGGMGIDTKSNRVIKCDLCDGDPQCVRFCFPGALQFVEASAVNLRKKREAAGKLAELMGRVTV